MPNETIGKTITVAVGVCVVCSVFVSAAAVYLKPIQEVNKTLDKRKNILIAADLLDEEEKADKKKVEGLFEDIRTAWIDFEEGKFVGEEDVPEECRDERRSANDPKRSTAIQEDLAGIRRKARYRQIYFTTKGGEIDRIILPVYGKGLWSTMYGFLALDRDRTTIKSFAFYEHGETPGLGGEVDNRRWKDSWLEKQAFDDRGEPKIELVKGKADPQAVHQVDGLSGATLTARGVQNLVRFWLGKEGYGPYLKKLSEGVTDG